MNRKHYNHRAYNTITRFQSVEEYRRTKSPHFDKWGARFAVAFGGGLLLTAAIIAIANNL